MVACAAASLELDDALPLDAEPVSLPEVEKELLPVPLALEAPAVVVAVAAAALPVIAPGPWLPLSVKYRLTAVLLGAWSLVVVAPAVGCVADTPTSEK